MSSQRLPSDGCSIADFAASTACAVPRRSRCVKVEAPGRTRLAAAATLSSPGPMTIAVEVTPAAATAASTCASSERPATSCSTFGFDERMRVPSPAASTIAKQLRAVIFNLRGALLEHDPEKWKTVFHEDHAAEHAADARRKSRI